VSNVAHGPFVSLFCKICFFLTDNDEQNASCIDLTSGDEDYIDLTSPNPSGSNDASAVVVSSLKLHRNLCPRHSFVLLSRFAFSLGSKVISKKLFKIILSTFTQLSWTLTRCACDFTEKLHVVEFSVWNFSSMF
jgi:hypothetical protein